MIFVYEGKKYKFNEDESEAAVKIATEHLGKILNICNENNIQTMFPLYLLAMKALCEEQLSYVGEDGMAALFANRVRLEKKVDELMEARERKD